MDIGNSMSTALPSAQDVLQRVFGYQEFRGHQAQAIATLVEGDDAIVLMPTGGGKSLCYQIPSLLRNGVGLVVSPLIALMQDQVIAMQQLGIRAAYLNSTLSYQEQQNVIDRVLNAELDLLYLAPERLLQENTLNLLSKVPIALIAIDEAHCVSSWGHDFRQDYLLLNQLGERFPGVPRVALTATADARTQADIIQRLALHNPHQFIESFDRPNICYSVQPKSDAKKQLLQFLGPRKAQAGIVYCLSRRSVEAIASWLQGQGFHALPYHAGMDAEIRAEHQAEFLRGEAVVMVATIAFGMGIDKPDVRFVAHLDLPKSLEAYYQETGRAGRDGQDADAFMVFGLQDVVRLSQMVASSAAAEDIKRVEQNKLEALLGWCELTSCRRQPLLEYFDEAMPKACGNCDNCLLPPKTWDATEAAQKALSCVYRTGQRFGAGHVIDVLRGAERDKVKQFNHQDLSTFGIGADLNERQWRSLFRALVANSLLFSDPNAYGALKLTNSSRAMLKGERSLHVREEVEPPKTRGSSSAGGAKANHEPLTDAQEIRFESLRELRREMAEEQGVPPYVIFHDSTLRQVAKAQPTSSEALLAISGIGQSKMEKYGDAVLDLMVELD